jgi:hypothetical protein
MWQCRDTTCVICVQQLLAGWEFRLKFLRTALHKQCQTAAYQVECCDDVGSTTRALVTVSNESLAVDAHIMFRRNNYAVCRTCFPGVARYCGLLITCDLFSCGLVLPILNSARASKHSNTKRIMNLCLTSNAPVGCGHRRQTWHRAAAVAVPTGSNRRPSRGKLNVRALGFDFGDGERDSRLAAEPPRPSSKAFAAYTLVCGAAVSQLVLCAA